ncbi:hypothetical protein EV127DRAFT_403521 [Xylaria flabelliformis]|nr:hypothetical protein EV127DRAFT_403521 [Xylaria flabelliformis]
MGRSTRRDRRSRTDRKSNNSRRSSPDRDDDYFMHDAESNNALTSKERRGRRRNNKNNRRNSEQKNRDNRNSKKHNSFDRFTDPFEDLSLDESIFHDEQQRSRRDRGNQNRNRGDKQGNENRSPKQHNHHNGPRRSSITSAINDYYSEIRHSDNDNTHTPNKNKHNNRSSNLSPRSSSPARLARFCTECSTVRRANLKLRDWLSSAIQRASSVVDTWSDEVGVGRGSADEMDWQPEPVVRVLILATTTATPSSSSGFLTPTPSTIGGNSGGWTPPYQQQQQQHAGLVMGEVDSCGGDAAAAAANANYDTGSWGFRPGTLDPGSSMDGGGNSGGVWEVDDSTAGNAAVWNQMNYAYRYRSMMSPPETPPETPPESPPESPPPFMTLVT